MLDINNIKSNKKRIKWLDFAKGVTIFFVVLLHFVGYIHVDVNYFRLFQYFAFTFVMPVFFAISGYLYKSTTTWKKYKILLYKKCTSFIIPYIIFTFFSMLCISVKDSPMIFIKNGFKILYLPWSYLWFLYVLFIIFLIVGLMDLIHIKLYQQVIISIILLIISCRTSWTIPNGSNNVYPIIRICGYMICFYIGILLRRTKLINILKNRWITLFSIIIWCIIFKYQHKFYSGFDTNSFGYVDLLTKLSSIFIMLSIFINFNQHNWVFNYFDKYGKNTLLIYLVHIPIIFIIGKIISKLSLLGTVLSHALLSILIILVVWLISTGICKLSKRIKIINFIFYPRKYINKLIIKTKFGKYLLEK